MTVVNPKSISGITSITTASGSDNLLTIHTSDANNTERLRIDSTGATKIVTGIVTTLTATTGIVTTFEATTGDITTLRAPTGISTHFTADKISLPDSGDGSLCIGIGSDLKFNHTGGHSYITEVGGGDLYIQGSDIILRDAGTLEKHIEMTQNGAVDLYHNGTKKFETISSGVTISGDNSTGSYVKGIARFTPNDSTTVKVMWDETGFSNAGHFQVKDGVAFSVGNSSDLKLFHDGSNTKFQNSQGRIHIENSAGVIRTQTDDGFFMMSNDGNTVHAEVDSDGLKFNGDTAEANALDDYEEGTFTPNWDAGGGVTFSYSQQHGWYTKIGNTVTFTLYLQAYAATITGGNENNGVALQGLPFTIHNNNRYYPAFTIGRTYKFDINSDQRIYSYGDYGSTNARFIMETDDSIGNIMVANQLNQNTCEMFLSGTYRI